MTITVECPSCDSSFPVDPAKVPEKGVHARCSRCSNVFFIAKPRAFEEPPGAAAPEPGAVSPSAAVPTREEAHGARQAERGGEDPAMEGDGGGAEPRPAGAREMPRGPEAWPEERAPGWGETATGPSTEGPAESGTPDAAGTQDWVFEREPEIEPSSLDVEPLETVERAQEQLSDRGPAEGIRHTALPRGGDDGVARGREASYSAPDVEHTDFRLDPAADAMEAELPSGEGAAPREAGSAPSAGTEARTHESVVSPPAEETGPPREGQNGPDWTGGTPVEGHAPETLEPPTTSPQGFQFGRRDPHDKARRLARVLVSDMIMYNPERHGRALEQDTLREDFEDEIRKSWEEYVEQVGPDLARETDYFTKALNEVLARGRRVFEGPPPHV